MKNLKIYNNVKERESYVNTKRTLRLESYCSVKLRKIIISYAYEPNKKNYVSVRRQLFGKKTKIEKKRITQIKSDKKQKV